MPEKPTKPARKRVTSPKTKAAVKQEVDHTEIARRAYFIHIEEGRDDAFENWLRAERELAAV